MRVTAFVDEDTVRDALDISPAIASRDTGELFCVGAGIWAVVNLVERIEHAAMIEMICRQAS